MKKTIVLLLSLILLFSFVSCNGSTNSPSDSGSTNKPSIKLPKAPVDTNASSQPKVNANTDNFTNIKDSLLAFRNINSSVRRELYCIYNKFYCIIIL